MPLKKLLSSIFSGSNKEKDETNVLNNEENQNSKNENTVDETANNTEAKFNRTRSFDRKLDGADNRRFQRNNIQRNNRSERQQFSEEQLKDLPPNTIYNAVRAFKKDVEFSRKDLRKISNAVKEKYVKINGDVEPEKIEQTEGSKTFTVYCYPDSWRKEINNIVRWFYGVKLEREEKHQKLLALERLDKLKNLNSPDYETELVRFNIAEENKRKRKEKEQKAKDLKAKAYRESRNRPQTNNRFQRNNFSNNRNSNRNSDNRRDSSRDSNRDSSRDRDNSRGRSFNNNRSNNSNQSYSSRSNSNRSEGYRGDNTRTRSNSRDYNDNSNSQQ